MKAFPNGEFSEHQGMDLRDYFAGKALEGMFADRECQIGAHDNYPDWHERLAKLAYGFADAMMKAREVK